MLEAGDSQSLYYQLRAILVSPILATALAITLYRCIPDLELSDPISSLCHMATFITGTHHCPECGKPQSSSRAFEEHREGGRHVDWCAFICPEGHEWARPGWQAVK